MSLLRYSLPLDAQFIDQAARLIVDEFADPAQPARLAELKIIIPNLMLAPALNSALAQAAGGGPLLLPTMDTLPGTLANWEAGLSPMPDARRQLLLHAQLRRQKWFDDAALWEVVGELTALFDQLTEHAVRLPDTEEELTDQLARAFELKSSALVAFEARVAHTLWQAESQGAPSRAAARVVAAARWAQQLNQPLCVIAEEAPSDQTFPLLMRLLNECAQRLPVMLLVPDRSVAQGTLARTLNIAWPVAVADQPDELLVDRAARLGMTDVQECLQHVRFATADGLESLAIAVAEQVCKWIEQGKEQIALVAADRIAARRARALLERRKVWVEDETGWKFSTTRAAAAVDAWIETLSSDGYHRALVDLLKSPLMFADMPVVRAAGALQVERVLARERIVSGLDAIVKTLNEYHDSSELDDAHGAEQGQGVRLLNRVCEARREMPASGSASISQWLTWLERALGVLGALEALEQDSAGKEWLVWLRERRAQLLDDQGHEVPRFSLTQWRQWFNREMDATLFRDRSIDSPVVMTHLAAARLRTFDAAIVIGADSEHLRPPQSPAWLAHEGVRRELGLPGKDRDKWRLREDMAGLMLCCDEVVFAWQNMQREERILPAPDLEVLIRVWNWHEKNLVRSAQRPVLPVPEEKPFVMPVPTVPEERIPPKVSASAMKSLLSCPYQYFSRYVLRLSEQDEVSEALEKRDFGDQLHALLQTFHKMFPRLEGYDDAELLAVLEGLTEQAFEPLVSRNFLDHAWRLRWLANLESYIAWQREREKEGWYFKTAEEDAAREVTLSEGHTIQLYGRLDRVDARQNELSLLDYKARTLSALRKQVNDADDVQLAFYTLLKDGTDDKDVTQAAYVAIDDQKVAEVPVSEPQQAAGDLWQRIDEIFTELHHGTGMPANGSPETACIYCEARGLCRKDWQM